MSINLEEDKIDSLANANTNDIKELSDQVIKLRDLEDKFASKEEELKKDIVKERSLLKCFESIKKLKKYGINV